MGPSDEDWPEQDAESRLVEIRSMLSQGRMEIADRRKRLRESCIEEDPATRTVTWWRAPTAAECAAIDDYARAWRDRMAGVLAEEERLKQVIRDKARVRERVEAEKRKATAARARKAAKNSNQGSLFDA